MFEYRIQLPLPLAFASHPDRTPVYLTVSQFNSDPGLQIKDEFFLDGYAFGWRGNEPFQANVMVTGRKKFVIPKKSENASDIFRVDIIVEVADKERLPEICEILKEFNPGKYVDPPQISEN
jgi:hypothetical protein